MALTSGFYNALNVNGRYDRLYNADDYTNVFAAFIKDGVRRSGEDDFKVSSAGMDISVGLGYAVCGGRWVRLDALYNLTTVSPPVGDYSRVDAVVLRVDENETVRAASLVYRMGTPASSPVIPNKDSTTGVHELILATVLVNPNTTSVVVTDQRANEELCGWVTTPVGYDEYFATLDAHFYEWFREKQDTLASATLFKQYTWRTVTEAMGNSVVFDIPQYDASGVDIIEVYVNGLRETAGIDYTLNGSNILFTGAKVAGTEIVVLCYKSIDGTGLGTVADEVTELQNALSTLGNMSEYNYICNGLTDNVALSEIAQQFLAEASDSKTATIRVYGTFGATNAYSGDGSTTNPFKWFAFGTTATTTRRICFDFGNCSQLAWNCPAGTHNVLFYGHNVHVKDFKMRVDCSNPNSSCVAFSSTSGNVLCERGVIQVFGYSDCYAAATGVFRDCSFAILNNAGLGRCFIPTSDSFLRLFGGDFSAYGASGRGSAVVHVPATATNAVVITEAISCPTVARSGYSQGHAVYDLSANKKCNYIGTVTTLTMDAASQYVAGTIPANKTTGTW